MPIILIKATLLWLMCVWGGGHHFYNFVGIGHFIFYFSTMLAMLTSLLEFHDFGNDLIRNLSSNIGLMCALIFGIN